MRITGVNGATTRVAYYDIVVDDGRPRMTTAPTSQLVTGKTVSSTKVPVRTSWLACDGLYLDGYQAQVRVGSTWSSVAAGLATSIAPGLAFNTTYRYRARARDLDGFSAYAYGPYFQPRLAQQTSTSVKFSGTWSTHSSSSHLGGSARYTTVAGRSVSHGFTGSSIAWVGAVGPTRGQARVYIDGVLKATVNTYAASVAYRRTLYTFSWPSQGSHTIKIVVVGTPGHARVDVDAFVRLYRT
jgi:hypothetical protein